MEAPVGSGASSAGELIDGKDLQGLTVTDTEGLDEGWRSEMKELEIVKESNVLRIKNVRVSDWKEAHTRIASEHRVAYAALQQVGHLPLSTVGIRTDKFMFRPAKVKWGSRKGPFHDLVIVGLGESWTLSLFESVVEFLRDLFVEP